MKKIFYLLLSLLLISSELLSEDITANSIEISRIWNQIDELERRKPILNGVIGFTADQIPRVTGTIGTVKEHADKLERTQWNNMWKTMMGGSIQVVLGVAGSGGAKLVDIGVWLVGQGIDSAMSNAGGGVPYYSQKLKTFSATNKNLTKELDKLYEISKSSDAAMKAYYNKYRKDSGWFSGAEIGNVGVFTQRSRLIVEQSQIAVVSLEALKTNLINESNNALLALGQTERELNELKRRLNVLRNETPRVLTSISPELTLMELSEGALLNVSAKVNSGVAPSECINAPAYLAGLASRMVNINATRGAKVKKLNEVRKEYAQEYAQAIDEIEKKYKKNIKKI